MTMAAIAMNKMESTSQIQGKDSTKDVEIKINHMA
jgi:hypothetical protein